MVGQLSMKGGPGWRRGRGPFLGRSGAHGHACTRTCCACTPAPGRKDGAPITELRMLRLFWAKCC